MLNYTQLNMLGQFFSHGGHIWYPDQKFYARFNQCRPGTWPDWPDAIPNPTDEYQKHRKLGYTSFPHYGKRIKFRYFI